MLPAIRRVLGRSTLIVILQYIPTYYHVVVPLSRYICIRERTATQARKKVKFRKHNRKPKRRLNVSISSQVVGKKKGSSSRVIELLSAGWLAAANRGISTFAAVFC